MDSQILFKIKTYSGEEISIYGPTCEILGSSKPVNSKVKYGSYIMKERNDRLKYLNSWKIRKTYYEQGKMDEFDNEKNKVILETNWKLRVLNEQENERIIIEKAAIALLEFAEKVKKEMRDKERYEKAQSSREYNLKFRINQPLRKSSRLLNKK